MIDATMVNTQATRKAQKPKTNSHCHILGEKAMGFDEKLKNMREEIKSLKLDDEEVLKRTVLVMGYPWDIPQELLASEVNLAASTAGPNGWQNSTPTAEDVLKNRSHESFLECENPCHLSPDAAEDTLQFNYPVDGFEKDNVDGVSKSPAEVLKNPSPIEEGTYVVPDKNTLSVERVDVRDIFPLGEEDLNVSFPKGTPRGEIEEKRGNIEGEVEPAAYKDKTFVPKPLPPGSQYKEQIIYEAVKPETHHDIGIPKVSSQNAHKPSRYEEPMQPDDIFIQIADKIELTVKGQEHEMNIRLKPDYLGDVMIKVSTEKGRFKAEFYVENPEVRHTLQSYSQDLKGQFLEKGLDFTEISVYHMSDSWQTNSQNHGFTGQNHQGHPKKSRFIGVDGIADEALVNSSYNLWDEDSSVNYMI